MSKVIPIYVRRAHYAAQDISWQAEVRQRVLRYRMRHWLIRHQFIIAGVMAAWVGILALLDWLLP